MHTHTAVACALLSSVASSVVLAQCPVAFTSPLANGGFPGLYMVTADFNGDGRPDVANGSNTGANTCSVYLNAGAAGFSAPILIALPGTTSSFGTPIAVGDFNRDGRPDIAAACGSTLQLSIVLNTGSGTFAAPVNRPLANQPYCMVTADFNNDGKLDLAVGGAGDANGIAFFFGNGDGTFGPRLSNPTLALSLAAGDVNNDGKADLVAAVSVFNTVNVLLSTGATTASAFTAGPTFTLTSAASPAIADLNGDGAVDLIVGSGNSLAVYRGSGGGVLTSVGTFPGGSGGTLGAMVFDYNGDGKLDIGNPCGGREVNILLANGTGTTISFAAPQSISGVYNTWSAVTVDVDRDGTPDIVQQGSYNLGDQLSTYFNVSGGYRRPAILQQPVGAVVAAGSATTLSATAAGFGNALSYRWSRNGVPLNNGGNISGATTAALAISPVSAVDEAVYRLDVSCAASCGNGTVTTSSMVAALGVTGSGFCAADMGAQGGVAGHDNILDNNDFIVFIDAFFNHTGCP